MRIFALIILAAGCSALQPQSGPNIVKVLPHYLDAFGNHTDGPTLLHRDVYQDKLRKNPDLVRAVRYDVNWQGTGEVTVRLEIRSAEIRQFVQRKIEQKIEQKKTIKFDKNHDGKLSDEEMSDEEAMEIFNEEIEQLKHVFLEEIIKFFHDLPTGGNLQLDTMTLVVDKALASAGIGTQWMPILIDEDTYDAVRQPESWRVTLRRDGKTVDGQKSFQSFLW
jgi:hypothetical protein